MGTLAIGCAAALLFTSGYLISRSALRPENVLMVYVPIVLVRTFGFSKAVLQYGERLAGHHAALGILSALRVRLYRALEPQALQLRSRFQTGDLLGLLAQDIEQLQQVYLRVVLPSVSAILLYALAITALGRMDPAFAWMMGLYAGFLLFAAPAAAWWLSSRVRMRFKQVRSEAYRELTDAVFGMSDWLLSGRTGSFLTGFMARQMSASRVEGSIRRSEWRIHWISQCLGGGLIVLMAVWAGEMAAQQRIEATWIAAMALIAFPLVDSFVRITDSFARMPEYTDSLRRLSGIGGEAAWSQPDNWTRLERNGELAPPSGPVGWEPTRRMTGDASSAITAPISAAATGLRLERVSFRYADTESWSLREVTLHVPPGGNLAILGRSGAGKSTLLKLMQGELQPQEGQITVLPQQVQAGEDESAGLFAVLNQKPYLFDTTVANNIRLGRSEATLEEIRCAAEQAGLARLIESLPAGYDTRMTEAGLRFSGGERQRIALARVLLQNKPIVLLDEPTVGLDAQTERDLMETVFRTLEGKTWIWVTHHLLGMERMDQILFMEQGGVAMQGTHEQLLRENARYHRLYKLDHPFG
ncbi:thiol reductant ABC exporter subunit CydC [Paenibacillus filicis]